MVPSSRKPGNGEATTVTHVEFAPKRIKVWTNVAHLVKTEIRLVLNVMGIANPSDQVAFAALAERTLGANLHSSRLSPFSVNRTITAEQTRNLPLRKSTTTISRTLCSCSTPSNIGLSKLRQAPVHVPD